MRCIVTNPKMNGGEKEYGVSNTLLNVTEAAEYLRCSKSYLYKLAERRELPHLKVGSRLLFRVDQLNRWLDSHMVAAE